MSDDAKHKLAAEEYRRLKGGDDVDHDAFEAALAMSTPPPAGDDLVERLNDEAMRLTGWGIDRGCVDSSLAGSLAREAADRIEALEAVRSTREGEIERLRKFAEWCVSDDFDSRDLDILALEALNQGTPNVG